MESLPIVDGVYQGGESNVLEFKSALKGLPLSIWDTYSAFANTSGGRIIIGIDDKTGRVEGVTKPDVRIQELWNNLNNPQVVNRNILREENIRTYDADGRTLIIMDVPRADRFLRPVYHRNMETGTFKRNGEGDFVCRLTEVAAMLRDRCETSYDSTILEDFSFDDIDMETLHAYRNTFSVVSPSHRWCALDDVEFCKRIGALGKKGDSAPLTVAGLLMFGKEYRIYDAFPCYKLDYRECRGQGDAWSYRLVTGDGTWEGNVFNFFMKVAERVSFDLDKPLRIGPDMKRIEDTDDRKAVRECLLNSLIHADYCGDLTVRISLEPDEIVMSNSGTFRIPLEVAMGGGESDPRNRVIAKMFSMIAMVERAGVGVNMICSVWEDRYGISPIIEEDPRTDAVTVRLPFTVITDVLDLDRCIMDQMRANPRITIPEIARRSGVSPATVSKHIAALRAQGRVRRVGSTRGHWETVG